jgi:hypothetical protein
MFGMPNGEHAMKPLIMLVALSLCVAAARADPVCNYADANGNLLCTVHAVGTGWKELGGVDETATEPAAGHVQDPGKVPQAHPTSYRCYVENALRRKSCVDGAAVVVNGNLRAAELLTGRPERVRASGVDLIVDCGTGLSSLRSRDRTPGSPEASVSIEAQRVLSAEICALQARIVDPRLTAN